MHWTTQYASPERCKARASSWQVDSPDGRLFRSFDFQIIRLLLHLKFGEDQRDGVSWICQYGPFTLPAAAQASGATTSTGAGGVSVGEIEAGDEPTGAPQGTTARVFRCQSQEEKIRKWGRTDTCNLGYVRLKWGGASPAGIKHLQLLRSMHSKETPTWKVHVEKQTPF